ncbi:hypothetical protein [Tunturiibacter gelidiferens]|uniref:Uncharacterized protein n=1 Tax=Tunturiibacter gelidiferens TaxID=3069689 RepID=A0AAU7YUB7_9BACT
MTMLPTRSCPRQFAVTADAKVAPKTTGGLAVETGDSPVAGGAGNLFPVLGCSPPGMEPGDDFSGDVAAALGVEVAGVTGEFGSAGSDAGGAGPFGPEDGGVPPGGLDDPSDGGLLSGSNLPKSAAALRILLKYIQIIATAKAVSAIMMNQWNGDRPGCKPS